MTIANTILQQLGGNRFIAMTGSKNFLSDGNTLRMQLARNASRANRLWITLQGDDTYTMRFFYYKPASFKIKNGGYYDVPEVEKEVKTYKGIYFDQLQELFTEVTGLYTRL